MHKRASVSVTTGKRDLDHTLDVIEHYKNSQNQQRSLSHQLFAMKDNPSKLEYLDKLKPLMTRVDKYPETRIFIAQKVTFSMRSKNSFDAWLCCNGDGSIKLPPWLFPTTAFTYFDEALQAYYNSPMTEAEKHNIEINVEELTDDLKRKSWLCKKEEGQTYLEIEVIKEELNVLGPSLGERERRKLSAKLTRLESDYSLQASKADVAERVYQKARKSEYQRLLTEGRPSPFPSEKGKLLALAKKLQLPIVKSPPDSLEEMKLVWLQYQSYCPAARKAELWEQVKESFRSGTDEEGLQDITGPEVVLDLRHIEQENGEMDIVTLVTWLRNFVILCKPTQGSPVLLVLEKVDVHENAVMIVKDWPEFQHVEFMFDPGAATNSAYFAKNVRQANSDAKHFYFFHAGGKMSRLTQFPGLFVCYRSNWLAQGWSKVTSEDISNIFGLNPLFHFHRGFPNPSVPYRKSTVFTLLDKLTLEDVLESGKVEVPVTVRDDDNSSDTKQEFVESVVKSNSVTASETIVIDSDDEGDSQSITFVSHDPSTPQSFAPPKANPNRSVTTPSAGVVTIPLTTYHGLLSPSLRQLREMASRRSRYVLSRDELISLGVSPANIPSSRDLTLRVPLREMRLSRVNASSGEDGAGHKRGSEREFKRDFNKAFGGA